MQIGSLHFERLPLSRVGQLVAVENGGWLNAVNLAGTVGLCDWLKFSAGIFIQCLWFMVFYFVSVL